MAVLSAVLGLSAPVRAQDSPIPDPVASPVAPSLQDSAPASVSDNRTLPTGDYGRYNAPVRSPSYTMPAPVPSLPTTASPRATPIQKPYAPPPAPVVSAANSNYTPPPAMPAPKTGSGDRGSEHNAAGNRLPDDGVVSGAAARRADAPASSALAPADDATEQTVNGAIGAVGPGDTLGINIMGTGGAQARVTVDADGQVVVPMLGNVRVSGLSPSAIGKRIEQGLRGKGFMTNPQVAVEVLTLRSRIVSVLGQVQRPGRYPIEGHLSVLELLAMAGGASSGAGDVATLVRRQGNQRINLYVGNRQSPSQTVQDTELQPGDVVFVPEAPRFYVYGEVGKPGAYPIDHGLNVMRALALAGGLTPRASDSRIDIDHTDVLTGEVTKKRAKMTDAVKPDDVIHVNERIF
ncbi:hypothetical protein CAL29_19265 [Bordetella genomosp. 10]|uniref:Soluble ligand binding domain-containing protein n=1 Tax=Bordetella genomosp. 10 TaxID=1416804 RepID=A0A261S090_9BORD|nr:SLBB domain-containing protein [Bordetella genomosp. 10]OZI30200.1 hypothetical protein CAL29_19265 [Bordetella genomosp. 10]